MNDKSIPIHTTTILSFLVVFNNWNKQISRNNNNKNKNKNMNN